LKLALAVVGLVALVVAARHLGAGRAIADTLRWVSSLGTAAPLAFIAIYILACVLFVPGSILTLGGGFLFGVVWGSVYVSIGATAGATCAFLIGRYIARDWIARKIVANARFAAIDAAVGREGWKIVALTRLSPVFPFNLLNYAFGLTRVRLFDYVLASWLAMSPGIVMYNYLGSLAGDLARLGAEPRTRTPAQWALDLVGLAATIAIAVYAARFARGALAQHALAEDSNGSASPNHRSPGSA
jgi:uncharacterized membrane protein YdjX (TVP38/TMEM64 family)